MAGFGKLYVSEEVPAGVPVTYESSHLKKKILVACVHSLALVCYDHCQRGTYKQQHERIWKRKSMMVNMRDLEIKVKMWERNQNSLDA